jgi:hypothetical protein
MRVTGLNLSLSVNFRFYLHAFEISRSCPTASEGPLLAQLYGTLFYCRWMDSFWSGLFIFIHEHYRDTAVRTLFTADRWKASGAGSSKSSHETL